MGLRTKGDVDGEDGDGGLYASRSRGEVLGKKGFLIILTWSKRRSKRFY